MENPVVSKRQKTGAVKNTTSDCTASSTATSSALPDKPISSFGRGRGKQVVKAGPEEAMRRWIKTKECRRKVSNAHFGNSGLGMSASGHSFILVAHRLSVATPESCCIRCDPHLITDNCASCDNCDPSLRNLVYRDAPETVAQSASRNIKLWDDDKTDVLLRRQLIDWSNKICEEEYGDPMFGGDLILPHDVVDRIVGLTRQGLMRSMDDFTRECHWLRIAEYGLELFDIIGGLCPERLTAEYQPNAPPPKKSKAPKAVAHAAAVVPAAGPPPAKRIYHCSLCDSVNHTKRKCPTVISSLVSAIVPSANPVASSSASTTHSPEATTELTPPALALPHSRYHSIVPLQSSAHVNISPAFSSFPSSNPLI